MLMRRPVWNARAHRLKPLLHRHKLAVLLGFRFVLGFRVVTPVILGSLGFSPWKFAAYDLIGAAAWATIFSLAGYTFGHAVEAVLGKIQHYEAWILATLALVALVVWLVRRRLGPRATRRAPATLAGPAPDAPAS
jgi:membrane protein DedA with SNARE-associated domain